MGSWGPHSLNNDTALDWLSEYRSRGVDAAREAMEFVLETDDDIDAVDGERALAAVEVLAVTLGLAREGAEPIDGLPQVDKETAKELAGQGAYVIMRLTGESSEVAQLWKDAGPDEYDEWIASLTDLRSRIDVGAQGDTTKAKIEISGDEQPSLEDLERAIAGLSADLQMLRVEVSEGLKQIRRDIKGKAAR